MDRGYSLIELLVAIVVFLLAIAAFLPFFSAFVLNQKSLERFRTAKRLLESEVSLLRTMDLEEIGKEKLKTEYGYEETVCGGFSAQSCGGGYEWGLYKSFYNNAFCIHLCGDMDYLSPYLKRFHAYVFWKDVVGGERKIDVLFLVGEEL